MRKNILFAFLILATTAFITTSCSDDDDDNNSCDTSNVTYTSDIASIFNASCAFSGCHDTGSNNGALSTYSEASGFASFNNGANLIGSINHSAGFEPMPYPTGSAKLSDCNISKIEAWISAGMPQ